MGRLSADALAYNGCIGVANEERERLDDALDTHNRAVRAASELFDAGTHDELVLVRKSDLRRRKLRIDRHGRLRCA
jgi:hypothetical protein